EFAAPSLRADAKVEDIGWMPDDAALAVGTDLIDRVTGKTYFKLSPPVIAGAPGQPRAILWNYHVLYEFVPATASAAMPAGASGAAAMPAPQQPRVIAPRVVAPGAIAPVGAAAAAAPTDRLIYKSASIPKGEVDTALR